MLDKAARQREETCPEHVENVPVAASDNPDFNKVETFISADESQRDIEANPAIDTDNVTRPKTLNLLPEQSTSVGSTNMELNKHWIHNYVITFPDSSPTVSEKLISGETNNAVCNKVDVISTNESDLLTKQKSDQPSLLSASDVNIDNIFPNPNNIVLLAKCSSNSRQDIHDTNNDDSQMTRKSRICDWKSPSQLTSDEEPTKINIDEKSVKKTEAYLLHDSLQTTSFNVKSLSIEDTSTDTLVIPGIDSSNSFSCSTPEELSRKTDIDEYDVDQQRSDVHNIHVSTINAEELSSRSHSRDSPPSSCSRGSSSPTPISAIANIVNESSSQNNMDEYHSPLSSETKIVENISISEKCGEKENSLIKNTYEDFTEDLLVDNFNSDDSRENYYELDRIDTLNSNVNVTTLPNHLGSCKIISSPSDITDLITSEFDDTQVFLTVISNNEKSPLDVTTSLAGEGKISDDCTNIDDTECSHNRYILHDERQSDSSDDSVVTKVLCTPPVKCDEKIKSKAETSLGGKDTLEENNFVEKTFSCIKPKNKIVKKNSAKKKCVDNSEKDEEIILLDGLSSSKENGNEKPKTKVKKKGMKNKLDAKEDNFGNKKTEPMVERRRLIRGQKWRQDACKPSTEQALDSINNSQLLNDNDVQDINPHINESEKLVSSSTVSSNTIEENVHSIEGKAGIDGTNVNTNLLNKLEPCSEDTPLDTGIFESDHSNDLLSLSKASTETVVPLKQQDSRNANFEDISTVSNSLSECSVMVRVTETAEEEQALSSSSDSNFQTYSETTSKELLNGGIVTPIVVNIDDLNSDECDDNLSNLIKNCNYVSETVNLDTTEDSNDSNDDFTHYTIETGNTLTNLTSDTAMLNMELPVVSATGTNNSCDGRDEKAISLDLLANKICQDLPSLSCTHSISYCLPKLEIVSSNVLNKVNLLQTPPEYIKNDPPDDIIYNANCQCSTSTIYPSKSVIKLSDADEISSCEDLVISALLEEQILTHPEIELITPAESPLPGNSTRPGSSATSGGHGSAEQSRTASRETSKSPLFGKPPLKIENTATLEHGGSRSSMTERAHNFENCSNLINEKTRGKNAYSLPSVRKIGRKKVSVKKYQRRLERGNQTSASKLKNTPNLMEQSFGNATCNSSWESLNIHACSNTISNSDESANEIGALDHINSVKKCDTVNNDDENVDYFANSKDTCNGVKNYRCSDDSHSSDSDQCGRSSGE